LNKEGRTPLMFNQDVLDENPIKYADTTKEPVGISEAVELATKTGVCYVGEIEGYEVAVVPQFLEDSWGPSWEGDPVARWSISLIAVAPSGSMADSLVRNENRAIELRYLKFFSSIKFYPSKQKNPKKMLTIEQVKHDLRDYPKEKKCYLHPLMSQYEGVGYNPEEGFIRFFTKWESDPILESDQEFLGLKRAFDWEEELEKNSDIDSQYWVENSLSIDSYYWFNELHETEYQMGLKRNKDKREKKRKEMLKKQDL
jgi:hypothetical protein